MGCDIHLYLETFDGTRWLLCVPPHPLAERVLDLDRDYGAFAQMAGARNYSGVEPVAKGRGVPSDASPEVRKSYTTWSADAHSATAIDLSEMNENIERLSRWRELHDALVKFAHDKGIALAHVRLVMWFDS